MVVIIIIIIISVVVVFDADDDLRRYSESLLMLHLINSASLPVSCLPWLVFLESSAMDQIFFSPSNGVPSESKLATYLVIYSGGGGGAAADDDHWTGDYYCVVVAVF